MPAQQGEAGQLEVELRCKALPAQDGEGGQQREAELRSKALEAIVKARKGAHRAPPEQEQEPANSEALQGEKVAPQTQQGGGGTDRGAGKGQSKDGQGGEAARGDGGGEEPAADAGSGRAASRGRGEGGGGKPPDTGRHKRSSGKRSGRHKSSRHRSSGGSRRRHSRSRSRSPSRSSSRDRDRRRRRRSRSRSRSRSPRRRSRSRSRGGRGGGGSRSRSRSRRRAGSKKRGRTPSRSPSRSRSRSRDKRARSASPGAAPRAAPPAPAPAPQPEHASQASVEKAVAALRAKKEAEAAAAAAAQAAARAAIPVPRAPAPGGFWDAVGGVGGVGGRFAAPGGYLPLVVAPKPKVQPSTAVVLDNVLSPAQLADEEESVKCVEGLRGRLIDEKGKVLHLFLVRERHAREPLLRPLVGRILASFESLLDAVKSRDALDQADVAGRTVSASFYDVAHFPKVLELYTAAEEKIAECRRNADVWLSKIRSNTKPVPNVPTLRITMG